MPVSAAGRVEKVFGEIPAVREAFALDEQQLAALPIGERHERVYQATGQDKYTLGA